jgi:hypothetical protein
MSMQQLHIVSARTIPLEDAILRVRAEFVEMPGMQLTPAQAARLWHFDADFCNAVLSALVDSKFLVKTRHEKFARA